jgi:hypothetical protein
MSVLTDLDLLKEPLDPELFPGVSEDVLVHDGFRDQQALTATLILDEVKRLMLQEGTSSITLVCKPIL